MTSAADPSRFRRGWRTVDFKPAPPRWRVVSLEADQRVIHQMAGWLIQESYLYDQVAEKVVPEDEPPDRRVIPGICIEPYGWEVEPIDAGHDLGRDPFTWVVLAPGVPLPSEAEEVEERSNASRAAAELDVLTARVRDSRRAVE